MFWKIGMMSTLIVIKIHSIPMHWMNVLHKATMGNDKNWFLVHPPSLLVLVLLHQMNNPSGWNAWFLYKCHGFKSDNVCLRVKMCLIFTHITILIVDTYKGKFALYFQKRAKTNKDRQGCMLNIELFCHFLRLLVDTNVGLRNLYYSKI